MADDPAPSTGPLRRTPLQEVFRACVVGAELLDKRLAEKPIAPGATWLRLVRDRLALSAQDLLTYGNEVGETIRLPVDPYTKGVHSHLGHMD